MSEAQVQLFAARRGGIFKTALALLIFLAALAILGWMLIAPSVALSEIESRADSRAEAETIFFNPLGLSLDATNLSIASPGASAPARPMLELQSLKAQASLPALMRGEIRIQSLELRIARASLVVDERGSLNLQTFVDRLFRSAEDGAPIPFYAESVRLVVEELEFVDNSRLLPMRRAIRPKLDVELRQLEEARQIFGPLFELGRTVGTLPIR